jgi:cytochrome c oxidase subunit 1
MISSIGVIFQGVAILIFVYNVIVSYVKGDPAGNDPWDAWTLEWSTSSPPPEYNFATLPTVRSRRPLWDIKHPEDPDWKYE